MVTRTKWTNSDGLDVYFGKRPTENNIPAVNKSANGEKMLEFYFNGVDVGAAVADAASASALVDTRSAVIPAGAKITSCIVQVETLFTSGGSATLDVGLAKVVDSTSYDANGLVAAAALTAIDTVAEQVTGTGALITTAAAHAKLAYASQVYVAYNTAAFTAGRARVIVRYIDPSV